MTPNLLKNVNSPAEKRGQLLLIVGLITLSAVIYSMREEEKLAVLKKDFTHPVFMFFFILIIILTVIGLTSKNNRIKTSIEHGVIAFCTSYLAHLNMPFAVFFIVSIFVYYSRTDL